MYIQYYRLSQCPRQCDVDKFGVSTIGLNWQAPELREGIGVMAISTGETRPPKAGEWYLLCDILKRAWQAPQDLQISRLILKLVIVRTKTTTTTIRISE